MKRRKSAERSQGAQHADADTLPPAEWDFSAVKPEHRAACVEWEYYREIPEYISAVKRCIAAREQFYSDGNSHCFENELVGLKHDPPHRFFEEWPNTPFTLLSDELRELAVSYFFPIDFSERQLRAPLEDTASNDGLTTAERVLAFVDAQSCPIPIPPSVLEERWEMENTVQFAVFRLDRSASTWELLNQFEAFTQKEFPGCRPPEIEVVELRGERGPTRQAAKHLRHLAAYRLLQKMDWKTAHSYTAKVLGKAGKGLYSGTHERLWKDAAEQARQVIDQKRKEALFLTTAGEEKQWRANSTIQSIAANKKTTVTSSKDSVPSRVGNGIQRTEWDFSRVANYELDACFEWEIYREIKPYVDAVRRYGDESSLYYRTSWDHPGLHPPPSAERVGLTCEPIHREVFLSWWPATPFQDLPENIRRKWVVAVDANQSAPSPGRLGFAILPILADGDGVKTMIDDLIANSSFQEVMSRRELLERASAQANVRLVGFEIDWRFSDDVLKKAFKDWLKLNFKKSQPAKKSRRSQAATRFRKLSADLKRLGAYRLLKLMTPEEAIQHTSEILAPGIQNPSNKGLYADDVRCWERARRLATQLINRCTSEVISKESYVA